MNVKGAHYYRYEWGNTTWNVLAVAIEFLSLFVREGRYSDRFSFLLQSVQACRLRIAPVRFWTPQPLVKHRQCLMPSNPCRNNQD